jgi:hypothetical protein
MTIEEWWKAFEAECVLPETSQETREIFRKIFMAGLRVPVVVFDKSVEVGGFAVGAVFYSQMQEWSAEFKAQLEKFEVDELKRITNL